MTDITHVNMLDIMTGPGGNYEAVMVGSSHTDTFNFSEIEPFKRRRMSMIRYGLPGNGLGGIWAQVQQRGWLVRNPSMKLLIIEPGLVNDSILAGSAQWLSVADWTAQLQAFITAGLQAGASVVVETGIAPEQKVSWEFDINRFLVLNAQINGPIHDANWYPNLVPGTQQGRFVVHDTYALQLSGSAGPWCPPGTSQDDVHMTQQFNWLRKRSLEDHIDKYIVRPQ